MTQPEAKAVRSWWRFASRRKTPFGIPFDYTDALNLSGEFTHPRAAMARGGYAVKPSWYQRLRLIGKKPKAWVVVDSDEVPQLPVEAYLMGDQYELCIQTINVRSLAKIYDDDVVLATQLFDQPAPEE